MFALPLISQALSDVLDDDFYAQPLSNFVSNRSPAGRREMVLPNTRNNKFNFNLNMHEFEPSDISVKFDNNQLVVSGKRENKGDGSYVYREFLQKCTVPDNVITDQMKCRLDQNGYLRIEAPLKEQAKVKDERNIPIEFVQNKPVSG